MGKIDEMTHDEIADFVAMRIRTKGYPLSFSNMTSASHGEQPDVLGLSIRGKSFVGEVKVSRADFYADKKKPWRRNPKKALGHHRVYITPKELLRPDEIPYGWMLWEIHGKNKPMIKVVKGFVQKRIREKPPGWKSYYTELEDFYLNCDRDEYYHFCPKKGSGFDFRTELTWMIHVMRRAMKDGFEPNKYANCYQSDDVFVDQLESGSENE